jgi:hypothetical protein
MSFYSNSVITYVPEPTYVFYDIDTNPIVFPSTTYNVPFPDRGYIALDIFISGGGGGGGYGSSDHENTGGGGAGSGQQIGYIEVFNGDSVNYILPAGKRDNPVTISLLGATSITLYIGDGGARATNGEDTVLTVNYLSGPPITYRAVGGRAGANAARDYNGVGGAGYWGGGGGQSQGSDGAAGGAGPYNAPGGYVSAGGGPGQTAFSGGDMSSGGGGGPLGFSGGTNVATVVNNTVGGGGGGGNMFYENDPPTIIRYGPVNCGFGSSGGGGTQDADNGHAWSGQGGGGGAYRNSTAYPGNGGCGFAVLYFHN